MNKDLCYQLGRIVKTHGLKGEVGVLLDVDDPIEYSKMESVFVSQEQGLVPFFIERISIRGDRATVKFETVDSIEAANILKGSGLYLPLEHLPAKGPDSFYYHDVVGFTAIDERSGEIGKIADYYTNGPQDILAIEKDGREILVPLVDDFFVKTDHEQKQIVFRLPDGLIELYTDED